jgi:hypothetical protein
MTYNPNLSRPPDTRNPASLAPADVANIPDQFAAFLNCFQVHTCWLRYCLRVKYSFDEPLSCHFFYPQKLFPEPVVTK